MPLNLPPPIPDAVETGKLFGMLDPFVLKYGERGFLGLRGTDQSKFLEVRRADFKTEAWRPFKPTAIPEAEHHAWIAALCKAYAAGFPVGIVYNVPITGKPVGKDQVDGTVFEWV